MKKLISLEKSLYKDIVLTLALVLFSIPVWLNFNVNSFALEAEKYDNYNYIQYEFLNVVTSSLMTYEDKDALLECETNDILVYNYSNTTENYSVLLKIAKDSDVNLDAIRINVNYNITNLNEYDSYEDLNNYYYIIDTAQLVASSQKYVISMWNSDFNNQAIQDFDYEFVIA